MQATENKPQTPSDPTPVVTETPEVLTPIVDTPATAHPQPRRAVAHGPPGGAGDALGRFPLAPEPLEGRGPGDSDGRVAPMIGWIIAIGAIVVVLILLGY